MCSMIVADVLVVGLGPAGASAAAAAAAKGAHVIAIDRKSQAGVPVQCAELVPRMIAMECSEIDHARRQHIAAMATYVEDALPHVEPQFPGIMIDRAAFDAALVDQARETGADCRLKHPLRAIDDNGVATLANGSRITSKVLIGADGPHSIVGKASGSPNTEIAETRQITVPLLQSFDATDIFLSAGIPGGYGWLFPKGSVANLGLGVAPPWRHQLKPLLEDLHDRLAEQGRVGREVLAHTGGAIPVGGMRQLVSNLDGTTVLLAGDAAGLSNPISGAGINAAVISGREAGVAAARIVAGESDASEDYEDEITALFGPSLDRALARRRELMAIYASNRMPLASELRKGWIAFDSYWAA